MMPATPAIALPNVSAPFWLCCNELLKPLSPVNPAMNALSVGMPV